jgi:hypothetical protein
VLATAGIALDLSWRFICHGDNDVVGVFAAFGAASFDWISGRKFCALHELVLPYLRRAKHYPTQPGRQLEVKGHAWQLTYLENPVHNLVSSGRASSSERIEGWCLREGQAQSTRS